MDSVVTHDLIFPYLLRKVTEKAALASYNWIGRGNKIGGDSAAVEAMRASLEELKINGTIVIGEGAKDESPQLYNGEVFGNKDASDQLDIAVDPLEGTTFLADGQTNAMAVIATAPKGTMFDPSTCFLYGKICSTCRNQGQDRYGLANR